LGPTEARLSPGNVAMLGTSYLYQSEYPSADHQHNAIVGGCLIHLDERIELETTSVPSKRPVVEVVANDQNSLARQESLLEADTGSLQSEHPSILS
jgi:hypothetical protein